MACMGTSFPFHARVLRVPEGHWPFQTSYESLVSQPAIVLAAT